MQQTTCGEIPKKRIANKEVVLDFIKKEEILFQKISKASNCLYEDGIYIEDTAINYLNLRANNTIDLQLKSMLYKEYIACEKVYPYLGSLFIDMFFNNDSEYNEDTYLFKKKTKNQFIDSLTFKQNKKFIKWLTDNASLEYTIDINRHMLQEIKVIEQLDCSFKVKYDSSFLGTKNTHTMKEYKFIIIDGYIESVGEIHHLLDQAYKTKVPHVIFCFGMSQEVEHVIKYNNTHTKFEIFPFVIEFNESTINILHDIAVLHQDNIVTSKAGQTISQAVREELKSGKEITFHKGGFKIKPVASSLEIKSHRKFIEKRIIETSNNENKKLLIDRARAFSGKGLKIYIPETFKNENYIKELDYAIRFMQHVKSPYRKVSIFENSSCKYIPCKMIKYVNEKVKSIKNIYSDIDKVVYYAGN